MVNILFCGVGGQGVLKASEIAGSAALLQGYRVKKSEVHGMAQRGGSVESHLRFGEQVHSPLIVPGQADFLVCLYEDEEKRLKHFLKPDGVDFLPYLQRFGDEEIDGRFINTYLLGILSSFLPIEREHWLQALTTIFTRAKETNREVFVRGHEIGERFR